MTSDHDLLRWMGSRFEEFGDIYRASLHGTSAYVIRDPRYAEHILRGNWQNYAKGRAIKRIALLLGGGLMASEGERWKRQRRMIQPAFRRDAIAALLPLITAANAELLGSWTRSAQRKADVDVTRDVSATTLKIVLVSIFGEDYEHIGTHCNLLTDETARNLAFAHAFGHLQPLMLEVMARRRQRKAASADILGMLMNARDRDTGRAMSDRQLVDEIKTLIVAGHETTAGTLGWIWYLLSQNPAVEDRLAKELDIIPACEPSLDGLTRLAYTRQIIEEALRLYPPGWLVTRRALSDDRLGDYLVPANTEIYIPIYFIQRHPGLWEHPDRFDPDRFGPDPVQARQRLAMLPFSAGPRNCIGELFARVALQIHVTTIAKCLRLRYFAAQPPEIDAGINLRSRHNFIMRPELRASTG
ncbi:MAG TPA: cytochrome P450 [Stellaceae bacterium]|nr:cytochrome P450 [Stellaceae bacterium]